MNNENEIQNINRLLIAARAGEIDVSEGQLLKIQKNYLAVKSLVGWKKLVPGIVLFIGLVLGTLGSLLDPGHDSSSFHFEEYNQKLISGTNTQIDDMRFNTESKMLEKNHEESRVPNMLFAIGVILCAVAPFVFIQFILFRAKSKKEMRLVDELLDKLNDSQNQKSA